MNKKTKIVVVGCGHWGKNIIRNFYEMNLLEGVSDNNAVLAQFFAKKYNTRVFTWPEILKNDEITGVVIAAPPIHHFALAKEALYAGKNVFVEKPLTLKVPDAEFLCKLADKVCKKLMVGHILQYHPAFIKAKQIIQSGKLGKIKQIYSNRVNLGFFRKDVDVLWDLAPHDISIILSLVGDEPNNVECTGSYGFNKNLSDVASIYLSFPGGERAHVFVSWLSPFKEQKLIVIGDKAILVFDDCMSWDKKLQFYPDSIKSCDNKPIIDANNVQYIEVDKLEPLYQECDHFVNNIISNKIPLTDGYEGLRVLKVLNNASESMLSKSQRKVRKLLINDYHNVQIHETATIDEFVDIGDGSQILKFSNILGPTKIGKKVVIGNNVHLASDITIGDNCKLKNNVVISDGTILEENVFCGNFSVFSDISNPRHKDHSGKKKNTYVEHGATIGTNAVITNGVKLGKYCFVGDNAVVMQDVLPHALVIGNPARQVGWVSHAGEVLGKDMKCSKEGRCYKITLDNTLEEVVKKEKEGRYFKKVS